MVYIPGDPYFVCPRCGFRVRKSETKREWTGIIVCEACYDPKHPQLDVRPIREKIAVKNARPRPTDVYKYTESETALSAKASKGATTILVDDATGIADGYAIAVELNNGAIIWTTVDAVTPSDELVTNGNMELDSDWNDFGSPAVNERSSEQAFTGTYSRKITQPAAGGTYTYGITQTITGLTVGKSYLISGKLYGLDMDSGYNIIVYLATGAHDFYFSPINGSWNGINASITSPIFTATHTSEVMRIYPASNVAGNAGKTFYVDDISIRGIITLTDALIESADEDNVVYFTSSLNETTADDL